MLPSGQCDVRHFLSAAILQLPSSWELGGFFAMDIAPLRYDDSLKKTDQTPAYLT